MVAYVTLLVAPRDFDLGGNYFLNVSKHQYCQEY